MVVRSPKGLYTSLCKKSGKTNDEISRNFQKTGFKAYFWYFQPEKYVLRKSGSATFQILPCINMQNFTKKYLQIKTVISGIFLAFSARKQFFSKIGLYHGLDISDTHLYAKIQKKLMMKSRNMPKNLFFSQTLLIEGNRIRFLIEFIENNQS